MAVNYFAASYNITDMIWKKFNALGTEVIIVAALTPEQEQKKLLDQAEKIVLDFDKKFSRFVAGNELNRFNNFSGGEFKASETLIDLLKEAKRANVLTKGIFEPAVIGSLESSGYDRSFDDIKKQDERQVNPGQITEEFFRQPRISELEISGDKVIKPAGLRLDLGGLGKGYMADFLGEHLLGRVSDLWISAGGDLFIRGNDQASRGWKVGVQDPYKPEREIFAVYTKGEKVGIATSGIFKRKGRIGGFFWHHLIDPRSGLPADNDILAVTAISSSAKRADIFAKTVLILGERLGLDFIDAQTDSAALLFFKDGRTVFSQRALPYLRA